MRPAGGSSPNPLWRRIYEVVARIPEGKVATYGQVAALAGLPRQARMVGYSLHGLPDDVDIPWHRVINARGEVSERADPGPAEGLQRHLLWEEGVVFDSRGRVDLKTFRWEPEEPTGRRRDAGRPRPRAAQRARRSTRR
jgi:methylated-DNA-protein-cysteine methyltransferase-like protein